MILLVKDPARVSYEFSVELQFEFEWLKRAINCSKWAISLQVGMRRRKGMSGAAPADGGCETVSTLTSGKTYFCNEGIESNCTCFEHLKFAFVN